MTMRMQANKSILIDLSAQIINRLKDILVGLYEVTNSNNGNKINAILYWFVITCI